MLRLEGCGGLGKDSLTVRPALLVTSPTAVAAVTVSVFLSVLPRKSTEELLLMATSSPKQPTQGKAARVARAKAYKQICYRSSKHINGGPSFTTAPGALTCELVALLCRQARQLDAIYRQ